MESMSSKMSRKAAMIVSHYKGMSQNKKAACRSAAAVAALMVPSIAFAQSTGSAAGTEFFCYIARYFKNIVGGAALVVIMLWAIEHIFGVAKLHDVVVKVGIAAAIVSAGAVIIANSGLTPPNCMMM